MKVCCVLVLAAACYRPGAAAPGDGSARLDGGSGSDQPDAAPIASDAPTACLAWTAFPKDWAPTEDDNSDQDPDWTFTGPFSTGQVMAGQWTSPANTLIDLFSNPGLSHVASAHLTVDLAADATTKESAGMQIDFDIAGYGSDEGYAVDIDMYGAPSSAEETASIQAVISGDDLGSFSSSPNTFHTFKLDLDTATGQLVTDIDDNASTTTTLTKNPPGTSQITLDATDTSYVRNLTLTLCP